MTANNPRYRRTSNLYKSARRFGRPPPSPALVRPPERKGAGGITPESLSPRVRLLRLSTVEADKDGTEGYYFFSKSNRLNIDIDGKENIKIDNIRVVLVYS